MDICLGVCLEVCFEVCLEVCLEACLGACLQVWSARFVCTFGLHVCVARLVYKIVLQVCFANLFLQVCVARLLEQPISRRAAVSLWPLPRPRMMFLLVLSDEVGWSFGKSM